MNKTYKSYIVTLLLTMLCCVQTAFADGTREMYAGVDGNSARAGILAGDYKRTPAGMPFKNYATMKVFAKAGEHIYLASSIFRRDEMNLGNSKIIWKAPNGATGEFNKNNTESYTRGYIKDRAAELGGPKLTDVAAGGYKSFILDVADDQEGVWEINFFVNPSNPRNENDEGAFMWRNTVDDFSEIGVNENTQAGSGATGSYRTGYVQAQYPYMMAFDISVAKADKSDFISGRVFTNVLSVAMPVRTVTGSDPWNDLYRNHSLYGRGWQYNWYANFYVLTNSGYLYHINTGGINPGTGTLFSNNKGIVEAPDDHYLPMGENIDGYIDGKNKSYAVGGTSTYYSLAFDNSSIKIPTYNPNLPDYYDAISNTWDITHKMFFCKPATDMPPVAKTVYGLNVQDAWLNPTASSTGAPELKNLCLVGKENRIPNVISPEGLDIAFDATAACSYEITMHFNSGSYKDVVFSGDATSEHTNYLVWDGKDGNGVEVPNVDVTLSGKVKSGEVHFPWFDLENNPNSFVLELLNADGSVRDNNMVWDDSKIGGYQRLSGSPTRDSFREDKTNTNCPQCISFNGDNKILDTWTYLSAPITNTTISSAKREKIDLQLVSVTSPSTAVDIADEVEFTFTIKNSNTAADVTEVNAKCAAIAIPGFKVTDIVTSPYTSSICSKAEAPTTLSEAQKAVAKNLGFFNLAYGEEVTIKVKATITDASAVVDHQISGIAYVIRPSDIFEVDANNRKGDGAPIDPTIEYGGKTHNNSQTFGVTIKNSNPNAAADLADVFAGQTKTVDAASGVLSNDSDADGDALKVSKFTVSGTDYVAGETATIAGYGKVTVNADGSYSFEAEKLVLSADKAVPTITCTVADNFGGSSTSTLDITIKPNTPPTVSPTVVEIYNGSNVKLPTVIADPEDDALTITLSGTDADKFKVVGNELYYIGGDPITVDTKFNFDVTVNDGINNVVKPIEVTVKAKENQPPYANPKYAEITVNQNSTKSWYVPIGFFDPDGDAVTVTKLEDGDADADNDASHFKMENGCLYYIGESPDWGNPIYNIKATLTDGKKTTVEDLQIKVNVQWVGQYVTGSISAQDIYYGTPVGPGMNSILTGAIAKDQWSDCAGTWYYSALDKDGNVYSYDYTSSADPNMAEDRILPVGDYTLVGNFIPSINKDREYLVATAPFKVLPREITLTSGTTTLSYTGSAQSYPVVTVTSGSLVGDDNLTYANWASVTSGSISNTFDVVSNAASKNYTITKAYGTLTVNAPSSLTVEDPSPVVYNGAVQKSKPVVKDGSTILTEGTDYDLVYVTSDSKDAGTYQVKVVPKGTYASASEQTASYTISKAPLTINGGSAEKVYDGGVSIASATITIPSTQIEGLKGSDGISVAVSNGSFTDKNVGSPKVNVVAYEISGDAAKNYYIDESASVNQIDGTITKKPITLSWSPTEAQVYDGTAKSVTATPVGLAIGDSESDVTIGYVDDEFTTHTATNADSYKAKATVTSDNYQLLSTEPTSTFDWTIAPKTITVTAIAAEKTYDKNTTITSYVPSFTGNILGEDVSVELTGGEYVSANAGTPGLKDVTYELSGADKGNYVIDPASDPTLTGKINPKEVTLEWSTPTSFVYDGNEHGVTATVSNAEAGDDVKVTTYTDNISDALGNHNAVATALNNANYVLPDAEIDKSRTWQITEGLKITGPTGPFTYDGAPKTPTDEIVVKVDGVTLVNGTDYEVTYTNNTNAGTATATITPLTGKFTETPVNFEIGKKTINVDAEVANKVYDGENTAIITDKSTGILPADAANVSLALSGTFPSSNAQSSPYDVTVSYALSGTGASNYQLSASTSIENATISQKPVTLSWKLDGSDTHTVTYDGNAHTEVATVLVDGVASSAVHVASDGYLNNSATLIGNYIAEVTKLDNSNYALPTAVTDRQQTWSITPKTGTLTIDAPNKEYDGNVYAETVVVKVGGNTLVEGTDYTLSYFDKDDNPIATPTKAGDYKVEVTPKSGTTYSFVATKESFSITPKVITPDATVAGKVYDGNKTANVTPVTATGAFVDGDKVTLNATGTFDTKDKGENKDVTVSYSLTGDDAANYKLATGVNTDKTATITAKEVTLSWKLDGENKNKVDYNGADHTATATVSGAVGTETVTVTTYTGQTGTLASSYTTKATELSSSNYSIKSGDETFNWTIDPIAGSLVVDPISDKVYSGSAHEPKPTVKIGSTPLVEGTDFNYVYPTDGTNTNAGTGKVTIERIPTSSYSFPASSDVPFTIKPAPLTISTTVADNVYDANTAVLPSTISTNIVSGVKNTDDVTVTVTSASFADKNVGTGKNVEVNYELGGAAKNNYEVVKPTVTGNITPATINFTASASNKEYDGNSTATVSAPSITTVKQGTDDISVNVTGTPTFGNANVGTDKPVTATFELDGADKANYVLGTAPALKANITAKELTITWPTTTALDYNGSEQTFEASEISGFVSATDKSNISATYTGNKGTNVGSYTSTVTALTGEGSGNYKLPSNVSKDWTIKMGTGDVQIILPSESFTYDGTAKEFTDPIVVKVGGVEIPSSAYTVTYENNTNASSSTNTPKVVVTTKDPTNYPFDETKKDFTIGQKEITITSVDVAPKDYDRSAIAPVSSVNISGVVPADNTKGIKVETTGVSTYANANAGADKPVTVPGYALTDPTGNYKLSATTPAVTGTINKKPLTATWPTPSDFPYTGSPISYNGSLDGLIAEDAIVIERSGNVATNVGGYTSKITGISGTAKDNYQLPAATTLEHDWTISKASGALVITMPTATETYDGTAHEPTPTVTLGGVTLTEGTDYTLSYDNNVNAGENTAKVTVTPVSTSAYSFTATDKSFTIEKAQVTVVEATAATKPYDGNTTASVTVTNVSGIVPADAAKVSVVANNATFSSKDASATAGDKVVSVENYTLVGDADALKNYTLKNDKPAVNGTISKAQVGITWNAPFTYPYDGTNKTITATVNASDVVSGEVVNVATYTDNVKKNVGDYTAVALTLGGADAKNYELKSDVPSQAWSIKPATDVPAIGAIANQTYNGTAQEPKPATVTINGTPLTEGTDYKITYTNNTNAGTATATIEPLGGYSFDPVPVNFIIEPKTITLDEVTASNKPYDGTKTATVTVDPATQVSGIETVDAGKLTVTAVNPTFANPNVATDKAVSVESYTLSGEAAANYTLVGAPEAKANITALPLTITWPTENSFVYDGAVKTYNPTVSGILASDLLKVEAIKVGNTGTTAANYVSKVTGLNGDAKDNYVLPTEGLSHPWTITKAEGTLTIDLPTATETYDGTEHKPVPVVKLDGKELTLGTDYTLTYDNNVNAGENTAKVTVTPVSTSSYQFDATDKNFTIEKAEVKVVEAVAATKEYDATTTANVTVTKVSGVVEGENVTVTANGANFSSASAAATAKPVTVTSYELDATSAKNYKLADDKPAVTGIIDPKTVAIVWNDPLTFTYDGAEKTVTAKVDPSTVVTGEEVNVESYTGNKGTAVNNYTATATALDNSNYRLPATGVSQAWSISSSAIKPTIAPIDAVTYNGSEQEPALTVTIGGKTLVEGTDYEVVYGNNTNAGTATATVTPKGGYSFEPTSANFVVNPKTIDVISATAENKTYNGLASAVVTVNPATDLSGVVPADVAKLTVTANNANFNNANAGTDKPVTVEQYVLGGDAVAVGNYVLSTTKPALTAEIEKATLSLDPTVSDRVYNGNTSAAVSVTVGNIVVADKPNVTVTPTATFSDKNVGDDKNVTVSYELTGAASSNYKLPYASETTTASITPYEVTLNWSKDEFAYDGAEKTITATVPSAFVGDEIPTVTGYTNNKKTEIGEYTAEATGLSDPNYKLPTDATKDWKITVASGAVTVTMPTDPLTYNGEEQKPAPVVKFGETVLVPGVDYTVEYDNNVNAGTDAATATIKPVTGGKYDFTKVDEPFSILPATITVKDATVADKVYDGDDKATVTVDPATQVTGIVAKDLANITVTAKNPTFADKDAADDKAVSVDQYVIGGSAAGNYVVASTTPDLKADITPKEVSLAWSKGTFTYDGTPKTVTATVSGAVDGETVTVKTYDNNVKTAVGEYTAEALTLSDNNYKLPSTGTTKDWTISAAGGSVVITLPTDPLTYNGEEQKPVPVVTFGSTTLVPGTDYTVEYSNNVNAGTETALVTVKPVPGSGYTFPNEEENFSILPATITVNDATVADKVYDGDDKATVTVDPATQVTGIVAKDLANITVTAKNPTFADKDAADDKAVTVDQYVIGGSAAGNYVVASTTPDLKADITPKEVTLTWSQSSFEYDGTEKTITATVGGAVGTETVTVKTYDENKKTEIGNYTAEALTLSDPNYKLPANATKDWSIATANGTVTVTMPTDPLTYNGEEQKPAPVVKFGETVLVPGVDYTVEYDNNVNAGTDAATATIKPVTGGKYNFTTVDEPFSILPKEIEVTKAEVTDKVYNGDDKATVNVTNVDGIVPADAANLTVTAKNPTYNNANAGDDKPVSVEKYEISGPAAGNYVLSSKTPDLTGNVDKAPITVTNAKVDPKTYDGNTDATVTNVTFTGVVGTEDVTVSATGSFADKNAAADKDVTVDYTIGGADAANYTLVTPQTVEPGTINKKPLDLAWSTPTTFEYDGTAHKVDAELVGVVAGDDASISSIKDNEKTLVGDYTANVLGLKGADKGNYSLPDNTKKDWTIANKVVPAADYTISIVVPADGYIYNGKAKEPIVEVSYNGKVVPAGEYNVTYVDNVEAGEAKVVVTAKPGANFTFEEKDSPFTINKAPITVDATAANKVYDGNTDATVTISGINGLVSGDDVKVAVTTATFDTKNAGTDKPVDVAYAISGAKAHNYQLADAQPAVAADITKKDLILAWSEPTSFTYDGTEHSVSAELVGVVAGDKVAITSLTDDKKTNAGDYTALANGLNGDDLANYSIPTNMSQAWNIAKKVVPAADYVVTITEPTDGYTYDGTEKKPEVVVTVGGVEIPATEYEVVYNNNVNAGEAQVVVKPNTNSTNYVFEEKETPFSIAKATITVEPVAQAKVYDGNTAAEVNYTAAGIVAGDDVKVNATATFDNQNAGTEKPVTIAYTLAGDAANNYQLAEPTQEVKADITPKSVNLIWTPENEFTFDGTDKGVAVVGYQGLVPGDDVKVTTYTDNKNSQVGEYTAKADGLNNSNYTIGTGAEYAWEIVPNKAPITIEIADDNLVYNGTEQTPAVIVKQGDVIIPATEYTISYSDNKNAGTATVTVTDNNGGNYEFSVPVSGEFTIAPVAVSFASATNKWSYDGTEHTDAAVTVTEGALVGDEGFTFNVTGAITEVGEVDNNFTFVPNDGTLASNYVITPSTGKLTVEPAKVSPIFTDPVTGEPSIKDPETGETVVLDDPFKGYEIVINPNNDPQVYNGQAHEPAVEVYVNGTKLPETEYTVAYNNNTDAGTATVTIADKDGGNFTVVPTESEFQIAPVALTFESATNKWNYDGAEHTDTMVTVTEGALVGDEGFTFNVTGAITEVGEVDNNFTFEPKAGTKAENYDVTPVIGKLTVEPAKVSPIFTDPITGEPSIKDPETGDTVTLDDPFKGYQFVINPNNDPVVYDGTKHEPEVEVYVNGTKLPETEYEIVYDNNVNAGTGTITVVDKDGGNFEVVGTTAEFDILPRELTLEWGDSAFVYDGTQKKVSHELIGVIDGDVVNANVTGDTATNANKYLAVANGVDNDNYTLANDSTYWTIAKARYKLPAMEGVAETEKGTNDGHINGLEEGFMIMLEGEGDYNEVTDPDMNLVPGNYVIYKPGDENHEPSYLVTVRVPEGGIPYVIDSLIVSDFGYCPETDDAIRYYLTGDSESEPTAFRIIYSEEAEAAGFVSTDFQSIDETGVLPIHIPYVDANTYKAKIQFRSANNVESGMYDVELPVNLSTRYMVDIFDDVISAVNVEERFEKYQWFHNDEKLEGETKPFFCEWKKLTGSYYMEVVTVDNRSLRTCKLYFDAPEEINLFAYPNPTHDYCTVELSYDNGNEHVLKVVSATGVEVYNSTFTGVKSVINLAYLANGTYVVNVDGMDVKVIKF